MTVKPAGIYTNEILIEQLGVPKRTLAKARSSGALRWTRKGHTILYRGVWILDWLEGRPPKVSGGSDPVTEPTPAVT